MRTLKLFGDRILVRRHPQENVYAGLLVLPDKSEKSLIWRGIVVESGPGKLWNDGRFDRIEVRPGEEIIYNPRAGKAFRFGEQDYIVIRQREVWAILEDD